MAERGTKRRAASDVEDDAGRPPSTMAEKRARFPKGKKAKTDGEGASGVGEEGLGSWMNPQLAAKERAKRRSKMREDEVLGDQFDIASGEVQYEENANFEDDGIQIEPFNLKQEREEGYFDANGNFVEYAREREIEDAWLDSVQVDTVYAGKVHEKKTTEDDYDDLSSDDIGKIKRSIANTLEPGETIIQALKRLKGTSSDKRAKMSEVTKRIFDQLTEDAMKLMENGEYDVYNEKQETFQREAEGYERLARAKEGVSEFAASVTSGHGNEIFSDGAKSSKDEPSIWDIEPGPSATNISAPQISSIDGDKFDMFGEDDENTNENPVSGTTSTTSGSASQPVEQPGLEVADGTLGSDYVYDESSGYYYSSSSGYYYDPVSGMYASASTGIWYTFDPQSGAYTEAQGISAQES